jgi:hypothetical protein
METTADQVVRPLYQEAIAKWKGKIPQVLPQILAVKLSQIQISSRPDSHCQLEGKDTEGNATILAFKLSQIQISSRPDSHCQMEGKDTEGIATNIGT